MSQVDSANFGSAGDPRMRGFKTRTSVEALMSWIAQRIQTLESEEVELGQASGRVLARDIVAPNPVPAFDRAAMDGYALRGVETTSASAYAPAVFRCVGRSRPGCRCETAPAEGEAVQIATGAPLPQGADTVVPVESTQTAAGAVMVHEAVPVGRNVSRRGEDIESGTLALRAGRVLRPQDLGLLSALGESPVSVVRRPRVVAIITGDELLSPGVPARDFQIPDANSVMIAALAARDGARCEIIGPLPDVEAIIQEAIFAAACGADLLLISGGSSAGPEDHVPGILARLGRILAHGLALRPASPTGVALIGPHELPAIMIPGNPVSCLCAYDIVAGPIVRRLAGLPGLWPYRCVALPLARKLTSALGRLDYARVAIQSGTVEPLSIAGASVLSSVSRADGFVIIPADREGYPAGTGVTVWCYDDLAPAVTGVEEAWARLGTDAVQSAVYHAGRGGLSTNSPSDRGMQGPASAL
jgi:molybdopterin molybdotransferase